MKSNTTNDYFSGFDNSHERILPLEGLHNLRDLGGYEGHKGNKVRWGLLYRAASLDTPKGNDITLLKGRRIKTIVDFRGKEEKEQAPDTPLGEGIKTIALPIEAGNIIDLIKMKDDVSGDIVMEEMYRHLIKDARPQYRELFRLMADPANIPLLFHCSGGKDRTGTAAALILSALGVNQKEIYADYILSAECLREKFRILLQKEPHLAPYLAVDARYLDAAFSAVKNYGGIDSYLKNELNVDTELLQDLYLSPERVIG